MAHTTKIADSAFIHDGGYYGNVTIMTKHGKTKIPFDHLKGFVAEHVRAERISKLENADVDDLLR